MSHPDAQQGEVAGLLDPLSILDLWACNRLLDQRLLVLGLARIAAEQAIVADDPQVAQLGDCFVGRCGYLVGVGQPILHRQVEQLRQFVGVEAEQTEVVVETVG